MPLESPLKQQHYELFCQILSDRDDGEEIAAILVERLWSEGAPNDFPHQELRIEHFRRMIDEYDSETEG